MTPAFLRNDKDRHDFLRSFEDGTLPAAEWTHAAHIGMATVYLARYGRAVLPHTRQAIRKYLVARNKPVTHYHETLTAFWLAVIDRALREAGPLREQEAVLHTHRLFGANSKFHAEFYSYDVTASDKARIRWMAPDRQPLAIPFDLDLV